MQWMVEEVFESRKDQEESFNRGQMDEEIILFEDSSSSLDESDCVLN